MNKRRRKDKQRQPTPQSPIPSPEHVRQIVRQELSLSASFSGPLPPPEVLSKYNDAVPDAAERIIVMAEKQAEHRMNLENRVIDADIRRANAGLIAGFTVALAFLGASVFLVSDGHTEAGVIVGGLDLVGLVSVFVYGTISRRSERQQRVKTMSGES